MQLRKSDSNVTLLVPLLNELKLQHNEFTGLPVACEKSFNNSLLTLAYGHCFKDDVISFKVEGKNNCTYNILLQGLRSFSLRNLVLPLTDRISFLI